MIESVNTIEEDKLLVVDAIRYLKLTKNEVIKKRKLIDTIRFWTFSYVLPVIPLYFLFFYWIGLDTQGPESYRYKDPEAALYFMTIVFSNIIAGLIAMLTFIFQLKREKTHYELESDKTTRILRQIDNELETLYKF